MRIGIVGAGRVGATLARIWAAAGHDVMLSFSRDEEKLARLADEIGGTWGSPADAVDGADAVLFAPPWAAVDAALDAMGKLDGVVLLDATNHVGVTLETSGAEVIAEKAPGARVVKAFNTVFFQVLEPVAAGELEATCVFCGDDPDARALAAQLIADAGFEPLDAGTLRRASRIEAFAELVIGLAHQEGHGPFPYRFEVGRLPG